MIPLRDSHSTGKFPFWVVTIIAINIYIFYLQLTAVNADQFVFQYALVPNLIDFSQLESLIPFITSQFLHGGFVHILSNMWFLWIFGDNVEEGIGFLLFPIFYLLAGVAGGFLQYIFIPTSQIPMLGASGAIAGVLGAYYVLFPKHKIDTLIPVFGFPTVVAIPASVMLFYWFFTQAFSGTFSIVSSVQALGGVAWFAHIGGFVVGWLIAQLVKRPTEHVLS